MDEFERRHGKRYSTLIFLPHASSKFRKLKISHRLLFSILVLMVSSLSLSTYFSFLFFKALDQQRLVRTVSTQKLERDLAAANTQVATANEQMAKRLRDVDVLIRQVLREQRAREEQLEKMRAQYEALKSLTEGQEKIAEAHRAILQRRTWADRLIELGLGFSLGVLSSLVASVLWVWFRSKPMSNAEVDSLDN
jgi:hypothetical protein